MFRIHSSLKLDHRFDDIFVGKQSVAFKEFCAENWCKTLQESVDGCTCHLKITEMMLHHLSPQYYSNDVAALATSILLKYCCSTCHINITKMML